MKTKVRLKLTPEIANCLNKRLDSVAITSDDFIIKGHFVFSFLFIN